MQSLLGVIEQCFKSGKRQVWHASSVNNICVGLLSGLKVFKPLSCSNVACVTHPSPLHLFHFKM